MKNQMREYVESLPDSVKMELAEDWQHFEETAVIGDTLLREKTEDVMQMFHVNSGMFVMCAQSMAHEVFFYFGMKYIRAHLDGDIPKES